MSTPEGSLLGKPISARLLLFVVNFPGIMTAYRFALGFIHMNDDVIFTVGTAEIGLHVKFGTWYTGRSLLSHFLFGFIGDRGDLGCDRRAGVGNCLGPSLDHPREPGCVRFLFLSFNLLSGDKV